MLNVVLNEGIIILPLGICRIFMSKNVIVVKSNEFVEASYKITLDEMRVLLLTIGKIDSTVKNHKRDFEFTVSEFANRFNIDEKSAYAQVQKAVDMLGSRWAMIENTEQVQRKVTFLTEQAYFKGEGRFQIILHEKLMPFVSDIAGHFTKYNLNYVSKFNGFHSIRIYEILAQYKSVGWREVQIYELKEWLQVSDKYPRWDNFKSRVIEPSIKEINEKSDLNVSVEQIKKGRTIHALRFKISEKGIDYKVTKHGRPKLPKRPAVKKGTHEEGVYIRQCEKIIREYWKRQYPTLSWEDVLPKLPTDELKLLYKLYKSLGDSFAYQQIIKILGGN